jgi:hypothetical protein
MGSYDLNTWGIYAMPLGVLLCFGPALIVWIRAELRSAAEERQSQEPKSVPAVKAPNR